jgi:hypothetical protein
MARTGKEAAKDAGKLMHSPNKKVRKVAASDLRQREKPRGGKRSPKRRG